jgi:glycosyltransferase involved in cell wall biosynthesis
MPDSAKTLVILSPAFPADENDSAWVPSKQLFVKKLKENFPDVTIIVLAFSYPEHTNAYAWHGVEVIPFNGMHAKKLGRIALWARVWKRLAKIHRQQNIIGIYSFWCGPCALVGSYFAKRKKLKHFCWISGMDALKNNKLVKYIRPKPGELVAMSLFLEQEFEKNHGTRPKYVIPIGIDPTEFSNNRPARDIDIMGAGSFNPFKQYTIFVEIVKTISTKFPQVKAVLCGKGTEKELLEKMIRDYGLEPNITLVGMQPKEEVLQYMQRSRIFLHPSSYEGFGAVCLEALYAGAEVISFCDPMKTTEPCWHIVQNADDMAEEALALMERPVARHEPVLLYSMDDSAKAVMKLFNT